MINPAVFSDNIASFRLSGPDGGDLLHRISTVDTKSLASAQAVPILFCTATGKIISFFRLTRIESQLYEICLDRGQNDWNQRAFLETLEKYTFAEKYDLETISPTKKPQRFSTQERIENLWSAVDFEILGPETVAPLDINLKSAISDQKGCYPGQEVIEKILSIGAPPLRLVQVQWKSAVAPGTEILNAGKVTSSEGIYSLMIARKTHAKIGHTLTTAEGIEGKVIQVSE